VPRRLAEGLYETVVTRELDSSLATIAPAHPKLSDLNPADAHVALARHFERELERVLQSIPNENRTERQAEIVDHLITRLAELAPDREGIDGQQIAPSPRRLEAIYRVTPYARPTTPLSSSTLLTRNRLEPALGRELTLEIASADQIEILVAFITVSGVRAVRDALEGFARRGGRLRVLTTVFQAITEVEALDALGGLPGAEVKISYDVRRTRLHAKAWLFNRDSELHTAYVGSANLTATALGSGQEWMVKLCAADLPHVIDKFRGTFESLWNDPEFEAYDRTSDVDRKRVLAALKAEQATPDSAAFFFDLRPFPFQEEILDRLDAERQLHGRRHNLVVAATGTGKTVVAALDYSRTAARAGVKPTLLFLAHRREILDQALATFRNVLRDAAFGELWTDGKTPERWNHVFATIQTAAGRLLERLPADHYRFVVVDEAHHAPARSYQDLIPRLVPDILLGLTATPERADGKSLLPDFDGCVAAELRLWHAFDRQLLVPFEYYGIADGTDLRKIRWSRTGYHLADLANVYTGNEARVDLILEQLRRRVLDLHAVRAIAFCVSVEHAEFMAASLTKRGVPSIAVHGDTPEEVRANAPRRLEEREVNVLCTCDLYNEGVDLPFVDTLLLLRPTSSATLFLQQIGRGLRLHRGKTSCLILDLIGQHRAEFRFDRLYEALTGLAPPGLKKAVDEGFPYLPSGCVLQLDAVARERVLSSLKESVASAQRLAAEASELAKGTPELTLATFLRETGREVEDVYRAGGWSTLRGLAKLGAPVDDDTADLSRRLGWLLHVDEPTRLRAWRSPGAPHASLADQRRLTMLDFQLHDRGVLREPQQTISYFAERPVIRSELAELAEVLESRVSLAEDGYPVADWPLALHRHYRRREVVAAVGFSVPGEKGKIPQGGILKLDSVRRELLFVTLDKSASSFSPTTRYRDYAIARSLFHWETQSSASVARPSGRPYTESPENGWTFFLFVRTDPDAAYAFLGQVRYQSHTGDRPIAITWALDRPMPAALFERFATLAQG